MPDTLDSLRRHEEVPADVAAALDFQSIIGSHTRAAVASLLTALLCDAVPGFHGDPGDWHQAGVNLLQTTLEAAEREGLITYAKVNAGVRAARETFRPAALLLLWGATRQGLEAKRRRVAMKRYDQRHAA